MHRPALVVVAAALFVALLAAAGGFGRTAYAQQTADGGVGSAKHYCWVTGVVEDKMDGAALDRSFGGEKGHLATADGYTVPSSPGVHVYTHQTGSDGVKRRFGDWFDWVYQQALTDAARRAQWDECRKQALDLAPERVFVRPAGAGGLSFAGTACDPGAPGDSEDWVLDLSRFGMANDNKKFGDYAGGYGDMFRPWQTDAADGVGLRPATADGLKDNPNPVVVPGVSHPTRSQLVDFLFYQDPPAGADADIWRSVRGPATTHGDVWKNPMHGDRARWAARSVGVPDGDILESVQVRWLDPSNPEGGDEVDPALVLQQQQAAEAEIAARQDRMAVSGNEVSYATERGSASSVSGNMTCSANRCTQVLNSSLVAVENTAVSYETNNGEVMNASLDSSGTIEECTAVDPDSGVCTAPGWWATWWRPMIWTRWPAAAAVCGVPVMPIRMPTGWRFCSRCGRITDRIWWTSTAGRLPVSELRPAWVTG